MTTKEMIGGNDFPLDRRGQLTFSDITPFSEGETPKILLERPDRATTVMLPVLEYEGVRVRYSMHTDSIFSFLSGIRKLRSDTVKQLYIQGRVFNQNEWKSFENQPMYRYFLNARRRWIDSQGQKDLMRKSKQTPPDEELPIRLFELFPKSLHMSSRDVTEYRNTRFTPETSGWNDNTTAWFNAKWLADMQFSIGGLMHGVTSNAFLPLFGGLTEFGIGSNTLLPGKVAKASNDIYHFFDYQTNKVIGTKSTKISNSQLGAYDVFGF